MIKKKAVVLIVALTAITSVLVFYIFPAFTSMSRKSALQQKQDELAHKLGVKVQDYPVPDDFPVEYFNAVLKPGMTFGQAHSIVQGYERVYNCYGMDEIYYYFSFSGDDSIRFMLSYDEEGKYTEFRPEDRNSRTLGLSPDCSQGLLGKQ